MGRDYVTLSTVQMGKFVESFPFSTRVAGDSASDKLTGEIYDFYLPRVSLGLIASTWVDEKEYLFRVIQKDSIVRDGRFAVTLTSMDPAVKLVPRKEIYRMSLILSEADNALMLNVGGFYKDTGGEYVYIVLPDEKAVKRNVVLGRKNPEYFEVISGLAAGDVVITSSYENFKDRDDLDLETVRDLVE
jgi:HlyD family secretion protein